MLQLFFSLLRIAVTLQNKDKSPGHSGGRRRFSSGPAYLSLLMTPYPTDVTCEMDPKIITHFNFLIMTNSD